MPHPDIDTALQWRGRTVVDRDGEKIGRFDELYLDSEDRPAWAAVTTGLFGMRQTFVPLETAREDDDRLQVPFDGERVKEAPSVDPDEQLTPEQEDELYRHYGLAEDEPAREEAAPDSAAAPTDRPAELTPVEGKEGSGGVSGEREGAGAAEDESDTAMTRSEEELQVGTRRRVRGRARLKKYVVTEHVQRTIPVQREEVRVEYEPAEGEARAAGEAAPGEGDAAPAPREAEAAPPAGETASRETEAEAAPRERESDPGAGA
jgi:stress response protein YsnF